MIKTIDEAVAKLNECRYKGDADWRVSGPNVMPGWNFHRATDHIEALLIARHLNGDYEVLSGELERVVRRRDELLRAAKEMVAEAERTEYFTDSTDPVPYEALNTLRSALSSIEEKPIQGTP